MFLQTVIEVVYCFLLLKFIDECNQQLPDRTADSTRCALHVSLNNASTKTLQMLEKEQLPPNKYPNLNAIEIPCLGSDTQSYFETFVQSPNQLLNQKSHWRKYWSIFCRARSCPEF